MSFVVHPIKILALTMLEQALLNKGLKVYVIKRHGIDMHRAEEIDDNINNLDMGFIFETNRTVAGVTLTKRSSARSGATLF
ncbi:TPA: hypothetical protein NM822_003504 [Salmonella enterica subsp. enterica serovar Isangi]|nr:hypothetical protein [Salmonella enterica subsp. enterica serovar Lagos]EBH0962960.1 hypothetical protein [Salmonella enterica subsp. enterica serovar Monschaui]EBU7534608.1 hypothetical protein [Salmonella enterica subsp. enterica serovar Poona]ECB1469483.1 hypothetical protein [Salmonella enterica subsp. enterica serovar Isangi]EEH4763774.1 hypothetical protein [Salmonella enterica subsp. enterica serovar Larochelle]EHF9196831.1 hypothetical protein [Salmonella enterica subsp. enterica se